MIPSSVPTVVAQMIGGYRVLQPIGVGGMGAVYLAEHALVPRRAALKLLHPMYSDQADMVERFFNEARAASSIQDPGIVQIFDFGYHGTSAYIVMEYLAGEPLSRRLHRLGRIPLVEALRLTYQLAMSLEAAHAAGVVHRDLKPDNLMIVPDAALPGGERVKILDFGIAKLADTDNRVRTQTGSMLGTPVYMSPEQCRGSARIDHRSDVYSLGCVLFHVLCGRPPFDGEGSGDVIVKHVRDAPPIPSHVVPLPPELDAIVLRCLAKEPDERYPSMRDLAIEVDMLLRKSTGQGGAYLTTPLQPTPMQLRTPAMLQSPSQIEPPRSSGMWFFALGGVIAVAVGIAAAIAIGDDDAAPTSSAGSAAVSVPAADTPATAPSQPAPTASPSAPTAPPPAPTASPPAPSAATQPAAAASAAPSASSAPANQPSQPAVERTASTAPTPAKKPARPKRGKANKPVRRKPATSPAKPTADPYADR